jgi:hypothetical protein
MPKMSFSVGSGKQELIPCLLAALPFAYSLRTSAVGARRDWCGPSTSRRVEVND